MKVKRISVLVLSVILAFAMCFSISSCGSESADNETAGETTGYDPADPPSNTKEIVFLSGSYEEMGQQYGQQAKDSLERVAAHKKAKAIKQFGSIDEAYDALDDYESIYEENIPNVVSMWKGMAETSGISYEDILIAYTQFNTESQKNCSTVSMWGNATADGKLICGTNYDLTLGPYTYEPVVVAYPEDGNAFIGASGLIGGSYMNSKGLVVMGSQGQDAQKGDTGKAVAPKVGLLEIIMTCDNAKQAKKLYINKVAPGSGENLHVVDTSGNNFLVEHTMAKDTVRTTGDFDENDYLLATNGFLTDEMKDSLYTGEEFWDDDLPRYWTEEKIIQDADGSATVDTLADALGCTSYYIDENYKKDVWEDGKVIGYKKVENGIWVEDNWDLEDYTGFWTPENREAGTKCVTRTVAVPEDMTMYVMQGCRDTYASDIPDATGNFWKITLAEDIETVLAQAEDYAQIQIWLGGRDTENAAADKTARNEDLNTAKAAVYEGMSYVDMAGCEDDYTAKLTYYSKAATAYGKAHCYAQLAQNDPSKLIREGAEYEVY